MSVCLYRRRLSLRSGAGQLVLMQAEGLERAGVRPRLAAERGRLRYFFDTGRRVTALSPAAARDEARRRRSLFVDHSGRVPEADLVFIHNLESATAAFVPGADLAARVAEEAAFFDTLDRSTRIVANSGLVRDAIVERFAHTADRIDVLHPGYFPGRFDTDRRARLRRRARAELRLGDDTPLIGFVSSGNLRKRGVRHLLAAGDLIRQERPDAKFLVVGSSAVPADVREHALYRERSLSYRPKSRRPEHWYAALDVFLYPAEWEEFGIVVVEALAMGMPVLTSRRVGAAECLPDEYAPWLGDRPEPSRLAADALKLLGDEGVRAELVAAGLRRVRDLGDRRYGDKAAALILDQKR
jgi:glycosyltransferase involved in cell wall biosynthesis